MLSLFLSRYFRFWSVFKVPLNSCAAGNLGGSIFRWHARGEISDDSDRQSSCSDDQSRYPEWDERRCKKLQIEARGVCA